MDPNINTQIEEDQNEDDLWYGDEADDDDDWYDLDELQKEIEEEEKYERASNCTCGAWIITKRGNVYHVADCCCGAE